MEYTDSRRWNYSMWRSNHHSPIIREEEVTGTTTPRISRNISKSQRRAEQCMYWPGINSDIKYLTVESCPTCQKYRPQEPRQPLKPTPPPERLAESRSKPYDIWWTWIPSYHQLLFEDANCPKDAHILMHSTESNFTTEGTICWTWNSRIQQIRQLTSEICWRMELAHHTSSPTNPRSNGQAESAVKIVKELLTRAKYSGEDP